MSKASDYHVPELLEMHRGTDQEYVYQRLRNAIMVGAISPGTSLTIRGLAQELHLSPTPIREALRRLSAEHAIEVLGNRRMTVPVMTQARFGELVALRVAIEVHAARRALPYVSDIAIQKMAELDGRMDESIAKNDFDQLTLANQAFHRVLYTLNPDQVCMPMIEGVWSQLGPFQRQVIEKVSEFYQVDHHKEILTALRTRDASVLAAAIECDINDGIAQSGRELLAS